MRRSPKKKIKETDNSIPYYKLVLLGENNIGKTQLLHRFNKEEYQSTYYPTFGLDFRIKSKLDDKGKLLYDVQIIEIAGKEDKMHEEIEGDFINSAHALLCVFDISDEYSIKRVIEIKEEYEGKLNPNSFPKKWYLIGNKKDKDLLGKKIPPQYKYKFDNYFEISAKTSIEAEFDKILNVIITELNMSFREHNIPNMDNDEENEKFEIDFLKAHGDIFNEECQIF